MYRNYYRNSESRRAAYTAKMVSGRNNAPVYSTGLFLTAVAQVIRTNGFFKELCASDAFQLVVAHNDGQHDFEVQDYQTAAAAVAWLSGKDVRQGFESDLLDCISQLDLPQNKMRLAMYAIKMYVEHVAHMEMVQEAIGSEYVGTIKERMTMTVHVFSSEYSESEWGVSYRTKATTAKGSVVTWYAKEQIAQGDYTITGTVTKHNEYKGVKETYLNRVKVGA